MDARKTVQQIDNAVYALKGMEAELRMPTILFIKGTLTETKVRPSYIGINRFLTDNANLSRLANDRDFEKLPAITQAEAAWLDTFMTGLLALDPLLDKVWKMARKPPGGQEEKILKHAKFAMKEIRTQPKSLGRLVKRLIQGEQPSGSDKDLLAFLPLTILCWAIADQVDDAMVKRPK